MKNKFWFISALTICWFINRPTFAADLQTFGPVYASSCANVTGLGAVNWDDAGNAQGVDDGVFASASLSGDQTRYLRCTDFKIHIASNTRILGIKLEINNSRTGLFSHTVTDVDVKLVKDYVIQTANKADVSTDWGSASYKTYGGQADTWSDPTISYADVNLTGFGFIVRGYNDGVPGTNARVDAGRMTIYYVYTDSIQWWDQTYPIGGIQMIGIEAR